MSETVIGIIPPTHELLTTPTGLTRWSAAIDCISVDRGPGNSRVLRVASESKIVAQFLLNEGHAHHLAALLSDDTNGGSTESLPARRVMNVARWRRFVKGKTP
jgi:hypothetical protein